MQLKQKIPRLEEAERRKSPCARWTSEANGMLLRLLAGFHRLDLGLFVFYAYISMYLMFFAPTNWFYLRNSSREANDLLGMGVIVRIQFIALGYWWMQLAGAFVFSRTTWYNRKQTFPRLLHLNPLSFECIPI